MRSFAGMIDGDPIERQGRQAASGICREAVSLWIVPCQLGRGRLTY